MWKEMIDLSVIAIIHIDVAPAIKTFPPLVAI